MISFQALPRVLCISICAACGNSTRSLTGIEVFDVHISVTNEKIFSCHVHRLRDFIGRMVLGSISSAKSIGNLELTAGLGFGRLTGRNRFSNPLGVLSSRFDQRDGNSVGRGGTLGTINWFQGDASAFYGIQYEISDKITVSSEYTPDTMSQESSYLEVKSMELRGVISIVTCQLIHTISPRQSSVCDCKRQRQPGSTTACWWQGACPGTYAF